MNSIVEHVPKGLVQLMKMNFIVELVPKGLVQLMKMNFIVELDIRVDSGGRGIYKVDKGRQKVPKMFDKNN